MSKPAILHTEASNGWAGQEIRILGEMLGMKGRGYEVLLATSPDNAIYDRAKRAGIETFSVRMDRKGFLPGVAALYRIIKDRGVGIVGTHSSRDSWIGGIAGRLAGAKVIRYRHISSALNTSPFTKLVYGPLTDGVITTGEFIMAQLIRELGLNPGKIYSVPTGINTEKFTGTGGDALRGQLGISADAPVIGMAAALRSWKGHRYMMEAMPSILAEYPDARLVLAGEGPVRPYIDQWKEEFGIAGAVTMLGHRDDVETVIAGFDISVMASYASEGIPQFALQSMASGKPVVGTDVGGIPEVVKDGITGLVVPPKDPAALAAAIKGLLSDRALMARMGEAGRSLVLERHTADRMLDDIEAVYGKILNT
ncbi:MAG: glycosyltransferase family 4 protein [Nitrospirae bacterium]|nr:glycosyltransferase family 4 protein [Nitrospirota bacterium]MBI5694787.1 glycosyltransferase family 4 protein [Nitrospirota bacterium]